jgi:hypothetical protein
MKADQPKYRANLPGVSTSVLSNGNALRATVVAETIVQRKDDPLDEEYRELMKLAEPEGCLCGIEGCPGHEAISGRLFIENHPLGPVVVEFPDSKKRD